MFDVFYTFRTRQLPLSVCVYLGQGWEVTGIYRITPQSLFFPSLCGNVQGKGGNTCNVENVE